MDVVFVSAPEDAARVRALAEALGREGVRSSYDRTLAPGDSYEEAAARRLAGAKVVVIAWTPALDAAPALQQEAAAAIAAGKALMVKLAGGQPSEPLAQAPQLDLSGEQDGGGALVSAVRQRIGDSSFVSVVSRSRPRFGRTFKFWAFSLLIALAIGGLVYLSPEGREGRGFGFVGPANALMLSIVSAFVFVTLARGLLHLSGRLVGKESAAYFSKEFLIFSGAAAVLALFLGASGVTSGAEGEPPSSFLFGFASLIVVLAPLMALGVAMFRAMRRMMFPRG